MPEKINKSEFILKSLVNAFGAFIYISAVAWLMTSGDSLEDLRVF